MRRISRGLALNGIFGSLGIALAPLMAGLAIRLWGISGVFVMLALANGIGVVLMVVFAERSRACFMKRACQCQQVGPGPCRLPFCW